MRRSQWLITRELGFYFTIAVSIHFSITSFTLSWFLKLSLQFLIYSEFKTKKKFESAESVPAKVDWHPPGALAWREETWIPGPAERLRGWGGGGRKAEAGREGQVSERSRQKETVVVACQADVGTTASQVSGSTCLAPRPQASTARRPNLPLPGVALRDPHVHAGWQNQPISTSPDSQSLVYNMK